MSETKKIKVRVLHAYYGCDTGCCGHFIEMEDSDGKITESSFEFTHPYGEDFKEWATKFAQEVVKDKFPNCYESIDWDTLEFRDVSDE